MNEATIIINGKVCSSAESMAIRCAVASFMTSLANEGLGDDEHGKEMTSLYLANLNDVQHKMGLLDQRPATPT